MINKIKLKQLIKEELSRYLSEEEDIDLSGDYGDTPTAQMGDTPTPKINMSKENADFVLFSMDNELGTFGINITHGGQTTTQKAHIDSRNQAKSRYMEKRKQAVGTGILHIAGAVNEFTVAVSDNSPKQFTFKCRQVSFTLPVDDAKKGFVQLKQKLQANAQQLIAYG